MELHRSLYFIYFKGNWTRGTSGKVSAYGRSYPIPSFIWNLWWEYSSKRIIFMTSSSSLALYYELFSWLKIQHSFANVSHILLCVCSMWVFNTYYLMIRLNLAWHLMNVYDSHTSMVLTNALGFSFCKS